MENIRQRYASRYAKKEKEPSKFKVLLTKQIVGSIVVAFILIAAIQLQNDFGIWLRRKIAEMFAYNLNYEAYWQAICNLFAK